MESLILVLAIAAIAFFINKNASLKEDYGNKPWPFYAKKPLSQPEQVLYFRLIQALPDHIILSQVQLSRLLGVKKGNNYQSWLNRINRMSADFVVCNKDSSIAAVIELDDASHNSKDRRAADEKKDKALKAAEIKIIRWQVKSIPDITAIQAAIKPNEISNIQKVANIN